jgi:hypothetical protein
MPTIITNYVKKKKSLNASLVEPTENTRRRIKEEREKKIAPLVSPIPYAPTV